MLKRTAKALAAVGKSESDIIFYFGEGNFAGRK
jgi:hypothetical protein